MENPANSPCKIVAVDGPAGSGKSSVCSKVCAKLGWTYVNTGFLYRSVAYLCRQQNKSFEDHAALSSVIEDFCEHLSWDPATQKVSYRDLDLTPHLYSDQAGQDASWIAKIPLVREKLLPLQRKLALLSPKGAVVDGRDIGSVVFPDADLKIFLTASIEERARRRLHQLKDGDTASLAEFEAIKTSIRERDQQDSARGNAPLILAPDAILIDSSALDMHDTVETIINLIRARRLIP